MGKFDSKNGRNFLLIVHFLNSRAISPKLFFMLFNLIVYYKYGTKWATNGKIMWIRCQNPKFES